MRWVVGYGLVFDFFVVVDVEVVGVVVYFLYGYVEGLGGVGVFGFVFGGVLVVEDVGDVVFFVFLYLVFDYLFVGVGEGGEVFVFG